MKKTSSVILAAVLIALLSVPLFAVGETSDGVMVDYAYSDSGKKTPVLDENGKPCLTVIGYSGTSRNVTIPAEVEMETKGEFLRVVSISKNAFKENKNLASVTVSDGIEKLGEGCFENCTELMTVRLSKDISIIPENAFRGCTILSDISLPDGVEAIYDGAFGGCKLLKNLSLPAGLLYIGEDAFEDCEELILDVSKTIVGKEYAESHQIPTDYSGSTRELRNRMIIITAVMLFAAAAGAVIYRHIKAAKRKNSKKSTRLRGNIK